MTRHVVARHASRALLALVAGGLGCGASVPPGASSPTARPVPASVLHDVVVRDGVRVDLYRPASAQASGGSRWIVFAHERAWPPPDERERVSAAFADAMQRRGFGVAVMSFSATSRCADAAASVHALISRAAEWGLDARPTLAGDQRGASLVAWLALDPGSDLGATRTRGVVAMSGVFDEVPCREGKDTPLSRAESTRATGAPPFLVLSAHSEPPRSAQSSRVFARALEHATQKPTRSYHVAGRDVHTLSNVSGERNDVGDLFAAFVRGEPAPGGPDSAWAVADAWGPKAPLSTEPFWRNDARLIVRRPIDERFRVQLRRLYGVQAAPSGIEELEPWPSSTYDAIDLGDYLRAHPELGTGDWLEATNARGEQLVFRRDEIARDKPVLVVGIDDERNLFRLLVTYNVRRSYSWKLDDSQPRPLLARPVGAFLHFRDGTAGTAGTARPVTLADFALTATSFRVVSSDPLAAVRSLPKPLATTLVNEQGCLQCHTFRGAGGRSHHLRASDGARTGGDALAFEEYPPGVLRRFLFEQEAVAESFGVNPIRIDPAAANQLIELLRP